MNKIQNVVCGAILLAIIIVVANGCAVKAPVTTIEREGLTVTTTDPEVAKTAVQPNVVEDKDEDGNTSRRVYYSVGMETCRELALSQPTSVFVYKGPNECMVIGAGGGEIELMEGVWQTMMPFDIWVEITPKDVIYGAIEGERKFFLSAYDQKKGWTNSNMMPLKLIPGVAYNYTVTNRKGEVFDTNVIHPDFGREDAWSQFTGEWYDFVYTTRPK